MTTQPAVPAAVIVLAAGEGTRMRSATPKVLHPLGGRPLVGHALRAARGTAPEHLVVVLRHQADRVREALAGDFPSVLVALQDDVPGTGRAVQCALEALPADLSGTVLVTYGDVPLLSSATLQRLAGAHAAGGNAVTVLTALLADPTGYGRVLRDGTGVTGIVEQKDATAEQLAVREVNSGVYAFEAAALRESLGRVGRDNAAGEVYLTDVLSLVRAAGGRVEALALEDEWEIRGVNDRAQLADLAAEANRRTLRRWMLAGVTIADPATTWIDADVELAPDVTIRPGVQLHGTTRVATGAVVGPDSTLTDVEVGAGALVERTHGSSAVVGEGAQVGPFAFLRPGTRLGAEGKIGTFVETKNATIGRGSKVPHLSYVGDATIGEHSNIGAASVFVNYDGVNKARTTVGDHVRMGSDNMYVAPVTVGDGAYSGAGTVIRKDVPAGALAINVAPQRNLEGWTLAKRPGTPAAEAAQRANDESTGTTASTDREIQP
ncbi:bifunctional UDP-N-acetylglucosamine diphosphorylase/glucosamine-1-phosphate N-acetyltransferase GlmU [Kineococcus radiotolerans]|uniref:Bifunctional protein GlmU n=1 Tax=Kineococcus radiotolerans (strain ATCC BAA-149 / DSM 14245 / SRS30216) TaxID=266940 RepID=GLMU_KINRD|nr:bifunctional UDP-N-acetylglucosamine diphosphorylase/glucosamine-1-phosphate N-acetyltransferase GlmU [Kineococcus radiotolerans]A6W6V0.1 RecName: Full=Bifunctional protein GlmU; Includes: RecName: Full=UDP-N-acetylglucosamine pyrophosphorylase; AltName: Full=N-acetylglucosamine-1-phosphate uridyltransferase; Includes: RecName: Full=Glucosamine-1-phosphate N-acetyltransferase [Kineococcus radiotolerans SRS30216 = ATCC BAA-149]ABS02539.1 UDP-N-acetylglucosamine pyrophosphorylase [Kineococcus ra